MTDAHRGRIDLTHAWEEIKARNLDEAEIIFAKSAKDDPSFADAWNGLGAVQFERGDLKESLVCYRKAHAAALVELGGRMPSRLPWTPENKPLMRSIHGIGLNHFRAGEFANAKREFALLLRLNPEDNQGVQYLLHDIKNNAPLWKKDV